MKTTARALLHGLTACGGLAAALLLVGATRSEAVPFLRPVPPDGYVAQRARHATVYAPTDGAAREGQREIRHARQRFRELFGAEPVRLTVVLADDPAQFKGMDLAPLRRGGTALLPFVTRAHLDARSDMEWSDGASALAQSTTTALRRRSSGSLAEAKPLAHEACHLYVAAFARRVADAPTRGGRAYGHAALPDWYDESIATLCESSASRAARRRHLLDSEERRIPLSRFMRMPHPLSAPEVLQRLRVDTSTPGVHFIPAEQARELLPGGGVAMFYAQAHSLGEFIAERGGPRALHALGRALAKGQTPEQALAEAHRAAPELPATVADLEAAWLLWLEPPPR